MASQRLRAGAAALALAAALWPWAARARAGAECTLHGQVTTTQGEPLAGIAVTFSNGLPPQVTDGLGRYEVAAPADGQRCTVSASKDGYTFFPAERRVWLSGDEAEASFLAEAQPPEKGKWGTSWRSAQELIVNGPRERGRINRRNPENWFFFRAQDSSAHTVETWADTLADSYMTLYDANLRIVEEDDDDGQGYMSKITRALSPGTYYVLVEGYSRLDRGTYTIGVVTDPNAVGVASFAINNGASVTASRSVTLDNTCAGTPTHYMASEAPNFAGATWQPYATAPPFTLSEGNDTKTVYFKVKNATGESAAVSDSIILNEPLLVQLVVNGPLKTGNAWPAGDEDWFVFTVAAASAHTIETWPGTLADNYMWLYADDQTTLLAEDNDSGEGACARIVRTLEPGTYFVKVRAQAASSTGTFHIRVMTGDATVTIVDPHGDPAANTAVEVGSAEVVFNGRSPGVLRIVCSFAVNPGAVGGIRNKVRACIEPVGAATLQWKTPSNTAADWAGTTAGRPASAHATMGKATYNRSTGRYEVKAVFTGLPASNADFGPKRLWAQIVDATGVVASAEQPLEAFYRKAASNNPGAGRDAGPNWFYFWKTGNVCGTNIGWQYENDPDYGSYMPGDDHVCVGNAAPTANCGPETYTTDLGQSITVTGQGIGPHCCAETIAHELLHKQVFESWDALIRAAEADGENDGDDYDDPDDDAIPNVFEATFLGIATDPNDPDTYNMGGTYATYGDEEIRCRKTELNPGLAVNEAADWAFPGSNSCPRYTGN